MKAQQSMRCGEKTPARNHEGMKTTIQAGCEILCVSKERKKQGNPEFERIIARFATDIETMWVRLGEGVSRSAGRMHVTF